MKKTITEDTQPAVIYARYSSHNQRDCSIEQQIADCEDYARRNNLHIVRVYADRHLSGTTDNRPQFQQLLKDSAHGTWKYVICWKIDRFARNRYDSATYKYRLRKNNVSVLYAKESIPDGPEGILLESVLEGSAEYYSAALSQNIKRGMTYNAEQCKVNGTPYPFGYTRGADGRYCIVPAQADIVREIFSRFLSGDSLADVASDLNARGIRTSRGNLWNKGSFHRMLKSEAYTGVYKYASTRIEGGMPEIITREQFDDVQARLTTKKNPQGRHHENADYLLTGRLICGHCGAFMVGHSAHGRHGEPHYYYSCQTRRRDHTCTKKHVTRDELEKFVINSIRNYVLQPSVMDWIADCVLEYQSREEADSALISLKNDLSDTEKAINNIMTAIEAGIITATTKSRLLELESKAETLRRSISREESKQTTLTRDQVLFLFHKFLTTKDSTTTNRRLIETFVDKIYLYDDKITITMTYTKHSTPLTYDLPTLQRFAQPPPDSTIYNLGEPGTIVFAGPLIILTLHFHS